MGDARAALKPHVSAGLQSQVVLGNCLERFSAVVLMPLAAGYKVGL